MESPEVVTDPHVSKDAPAKSPPGRAVRAGRAAVGPAQAQSDDAPGRPGRLAAAVSANPQATAGDTAGRDLAAVRRFIERFTGVLTQTGFPRTPARIFVALLTADSSRLTAAELAELLQASPASVSGGVRYLIQIGLVVAEGEPGSRRQHYRMPETVWQDIVALRERQFQRWGRELRDGIAALGESSPAGRRMAETVRYFEFITGEMSGLLARWAERNAPAQSAETRPER